MVIFREKFNFAIQLSNSGENIFLRISLKLNLSAFSSLLFWCMSFFDIMERREAHKRLFGGGGDGRGEGEYRTLLSPEKPPATLPKNVVSHTSNCIKSMSVTGTDKRSTLSGALKNKQKSNFICHFI
jgi:hypothetical protein